MKYWVEICLNYEPAYCGLVEALDEDDALQEAIVAHGLIDKKERIYSTRVREASPYRAYIISDNWKL